MTLITAVVVDYTIVEGMTLFLFLLLLSLSSLQLSMADNSIQKVETM